MMETTWYSDGTSGLKVEKPAIFVVFEEGETPRLWAPAEPGIYERILESQTDWGFKALLSAMAALIAAVDASSGRLDDDVLADRLEEEL